MVRHLGCPTVYTNLTVLSLQGSTASSLQAFTTSIVGPAIDQRPRKQARQASFEDSKRPVSGVRITTLYEGFPKDDADTVMTDVRLISLGS
jgi:hypothetical protein